LLHKGFLEENITASFSRTMKYKETTEKIQAQMQAIFLIWATHM